MNVLFISRENSCRTIMAEALFRATAPAWVSVSSAGCMPKGDVHPLALATLAEAGLPTERLASTPCAEVTERPDIVIALCDTDLIPDSGMDEDSPADYDDDLCPIMIGNVSFNHWGVGEPTRVMGTKKQRTEAFHATFAKLQSNIAAFMLRFPWTWFQPRESSASS